MQAVILGDGSPVSTTYAAAHYIKLRKWFCGGDCWDFVPIVARRVRGLAHERIGVIGTKMRNLADSSVTWGGLER